MQNFFFLGGESRFDFLLEAFFKIKIFHGEGSFWEEGQFSKENFTLGEFAKIPKQNTFYLSYFLFADSIVHVNS